MFSFPSSEEDLLGEGVHLGLLLYLKEVELLVKRVHGGLQTHQLLLGGRCLLPQAT
jgi:hypothetical protein